MQRPAATVSTRVRKATILLEPIGWGQPYQALHNQTDVSGFELFVLDSHNNYDNPFHTGRENLYEQRGWHMLITRDRVHEGHKGVNGKGFLHVTYISHAETDWEKRHELWMPKCGWYVPTADGLFHEGTLVPFETVANRKEATKRLEAAGIPSNMVSFFYHPDSYKNDEMFVSVDFDLAFGGDGRFGVSASRRPSHSGLDGVASLPAYREVNIIMNAERRGKEG